MKNSALIKAALQSLLRQSGDDRSWVVFDHPSGKFVQFTGSARDPLVLDLPWQPLSEAEFYRAVAYFKRFGVTGSDLEMFDVDGKRVEPQFTFNMTFHSAEAAARTALDVFEQVYQLPADDELTVETSWEHEA